MRQSQRYSERGSCLSSTLPGRIYRRLYVHPSRYIDDLQRTGVKNWHRRVDEFVTSFPAGSCVLDLGSGSRRIGRHVIALDIVFSPQLGVVGDAHHLPFRSSSVDGVVIQMVLEHVECPRRVVEEIHRVLNNGGMIYCEIPFLFPVHSRGDFSRWTLQGLRRLCKDFRLHQSGVCMGPFSALSALLRRLLTLGTRSLYLEAGLDLLVGFFLWPLKYLDQVIPGLPDADFVAGGLYFIGSKQPNDSG